MCMKTGILFASSWGGQHPLFVEAPGGKTSWACVGEELTAGEGGKERLEFPAGMTMELCHKDGGTCPGAAARVMV